MVGQRITDQVLDDNTEVPIRSPSDWTSFKNVVGFMI